MHKIIMTMPISSLSSTSSSSSQSWMKMLKMILALLCLACMLPMSSSFVHQHNKIRTTTKTTRKNHHYHPDIVTRNTATPIRSKLDKVSNHFYSSTWLSMSSSSSLSSPSVNDDIDIDVANVLFVSGSAPSGYGKTSPEPNPTWHTVANQLAKRLPNFAGQIKTTSTDTNTNGQRKTSTDMDMIQTKSIPVLELTKEDLQNQQVILVLGVCTREEETKFRQILQEYEQESSSSSIVAILADPTCGNDILALRRVGKYSIASSTIQNIIASIAPWSTTASGKRLLDKTNILLSRKSSEDYIFAILFVLHGLQLLSIDVVKSDINPSWEKGPIQNVKEFAKMAECCQPQIVAAITDPKSKKAIDLLNELDLRDQVGSYRVIVSNETPQLEDFTLCILQQNNCFNCDSPILQRPKVPVLQTWGRDGKPLTETTAKQILMGHLNHPESCLEHSKRHDWSWKIVVGANPAYDAFPMQHQIFYPSGSPSNDGNKQKQKQTTTSSSGKSLWYDPVFCVETLDGERIWCKRHYRVTPRRHWSEDEKNNNGNDNNEEIKATKVTTPGAWTLTTLDNGMVSEEHWTTVDAADDLSWAVLHYSGAARRAGQSYVGALLCTHDGQWPTSCRNPNSDGFERIRQAFRKCDLELWELFGGSTETSFMWSDTYLHWKEEHPPPLNRIGDISITTWRKREREKAAAVAAAAAGKTNVLSE